MTKEADWMGFRAPDRVVAGTHRTLTQKLQIQATVIHYFSSTSLAVYR